jgi:hypothetical protein
MTWKLVSLIVLAACLCHADTVLSASQNDLIKPWGVTDSATYGQTITTPTTDTELTSFTFYLGPQYMGSGSIEYEAYVYAWDATTSMATGSAQYQSWLSTFTANGSFDPVTFTPDINLTSGDQYVLFFSTSGLQAGRLDSTIYWGFNTSLPYTGGGFVFLNNGDDQSQWTSTAWSVAHAADLAFTADFASPVPEPRLEVLLFGSGFCLMAYGLRKRFSEK